VASWRAAGGLCQANDDNSWLASDTWRLAAGSGARDGLAAVPGATKTTTTTTTMTIMMAKDGDSSPSSSAAAAAV
jgi:hypothetical protein